MKHDEDNRDRQHHNEKKPLFSDKFDKLFNHEFHVGVAY